MSFYETFFSLLPYAENGREFIFHECFSEYNLYDCNKVSCTQKYDKKAYFLCLNGKCIEIIHLKGKGILHENRKVIEFLILGVAACACQKNEAGRKAEEN